MTLKNSDVSIEPVTINQVHQDGIIEIKEKPKVEITGDALITDKSNLPLTVRVADCQGILIFDPNDNRIAAIHSGWKGSVFNIIGKTIEKMQNKGSKPENLLAAISPSLGPCCAEFTDPKNELPDFIHPFVQGNKVDFWSLSRAQCIKAGVLENNIELAGECTKCNHEKYFSHRNKETGRMSVYIGLK